MPRAERLVTCGGAKGLNQNGRSRLALNLHGTSANVNLRISDISKRLLANIPDVLIDLLEVATYVYSADGATSRGGTRPQCFARCS